MIRSIAGLPANTVTRQRFLSTCPDVAVESTATVITCDGQTSPNDSPVFVCFDVTSTITASACSNVDTAAKAGQIEDAVRTGDLAKELFKEGVDATVILPPSEQPSS